MRRGGAGSVFVATTPDICNDVPGAEIVFALDLPRDTPDEIIRAVEDPRRVEVELTLTRRSALPGSTASIGPSS